ncbi:MAG: hypothetical protein AAF571_07910 [Verrucomicrobiota bacterium]
MKNLSSREKIMVMALPAVVLLMLYYFFVASPKADELERLQRQVVSAERKVPPQQQIVKVSRELMELQQEVAEKRKFVNERKTRGKRVLEYWSNFDAKARTGEKISELLAANRVILLEESIAEIDDDKQYSSILDSLPDAELWKLRLAGTYQSIQQMISQLGETDLPVIPAAIEMEPLAAESSNIHVWNLWICR